MANKLGFYYNSPTAGGTDGTLASEDQTLTSMITGSLSVTAEAGAEVAIKCAARCTSGYETVGNTSLSFQQIISGAWNAYTGGKFKLAADNSYGESAVAGARSYTLGSLADADAITFYPVEGSSNTIALAVGTNFAVGTDNAGTVANMAAYMNTMGLPYTATSSGSILTLTESVAGGSKTPGSMSISGTGTVIVGTAITSVPDALTHAAWADDLTISDVIAATNKIFWIKMSADAAEAPVNQTDVGMYHYANVAAS